jgi:hypothetical protein
MANMFSAANMVTTLADSLSTVPCFKLSIRNIFTYLQLTTINNLLIIFYQCNAVWDPIWCKYINIQLVD